MEWLDTLIVGAGPIGLACGIEASQSGLSFLLLEKGALVDSIYHYPSQMTFFSTSDKIEIGGAPFVSHGPKPTRSEALEYYRRVAAMWRLPIRLYEAATRLEPARLPDGSAGYQVFSSKNTYLTRTVIVATGFFGQPNLMGIPGEDLPNVSHYFSDAHPYIGQRVLVVGGANSAVDAALECYRKGAFVTLAHRGAEISHRVKYWVRPDIENRIRDGAIRAFFQTKVTAIYPDCVDLLTPEGEIRIENDFVLALTGFRPDYSWLSQQGLCISDTPEKTPLRNEQTFESNLPGVYLAGTVCGGMNTNRWFIENSIEHARFVMEDICRKRSAYLTSQ